MKKEEIINEGLQSASGNQVAPKVELEIIKKKHEINSKKEHCKWCEARVPFSEEYCSNRFHDAWKLHTEN